ncbi:sensor histidine kinase [Kitasatospora sp. NPDC101176]|uniref:sensor histidine kinase n=1 Tax=Kitasatospora sp. NPDC101176 TaxID=3364099 RepID=UPI0037FF8039
MLRTRSIRTRIAVAFGAAFLGLGALLLTAVYFLTQRGTTARALEITDLAKHPAAWAQAQPVGPGQAPFRGTLLPGGDGTTLTTLSRQITDAAAQQQLLWSVVALVIAALLASLVGWWTTARVLRPVDEITTTVREISATSLHRRLTAGAHRDEITALAGTFNELLDRLQAAFTAQRRFVANASHELRTPLAVQRTLIQVGLHDPDPAELAEVRSELLESNRAGERLIDGLLVLASGQHGLDHHEPVDLAAIAARETDAAAGAARTARVTIRTEGRPTAVHGDPALLTHLVRNLVANAVLHNHPGGGVHVRLDDRTLLVRNTGPSLDPDTIDELLEPFRRGSHPRLSSPGGGSGLGLSIVHAIAVAHRAHLALEGNPEGGLTVRVRFPADPPPPAPERHRPPPPDAPPGSPGDGATNP